MVTSKISLFITYATAPGFTATRALHACLRCNERYPLALNPKNSNANCLTNPFWKQGKSWKTLTKILLLTHCYSDCLYKKRQEYSQQITSPRIFTAVIIFSSTVTFGQIFIIHLTASQSLCGTSPLLSDCVGHTSQTPAYSPFFFRSRSFLQSSAWHQRTVFSPARQ